MKNWSGLSKTQLISAKQIRFYTAT